MPKFENVEVGEKFSEQGFMGRRFYVKTDETHAKLVDHELRDLYFNTDGTPIVATNGIGRINEFGPDEDVDLEN